MIEKEKPIHAMAFFDVQNIFRHAKDAFGHYHPNFDPQKLHQAVCDQHGWTPNLVRFYTGTPIPTHSPMWSAYWNNRVLALKRAGVAVTTRTLRYSKATIVDADGNEFIEWVPREKGIDVRLALDIVKLARARKYDVAVLYSQDQDLAEVVSELREIANDQERDIRICCAFPDSENATAKRGIENTQWFKIDREMYDKCLDPRDYRPKRKP